MFNFRERKRERVFAEQKIFFKIYQKFQLFYLNLKIEILKNYLFFIFVNIYEGYLQKLTSNTATLLINIVNLRL